jgi:hypothetical protein
VKPFVFPLAALCGCVLAVALCVTGGAWLAAFAFALAAFLAGDLALARSAARRHALRADALEGKVPSITDAEPHEVRRLWDRR